MFAVVEHDSGYAVCDTVRCTLTHFAERRHAVWYAACRLAGLAQRTSRRLAPIIAEQVSEEPPILVYRGEEAGCGRVYLLGADLWLGLGSSLHSCAPKSVWGSTREAAVCRLYRRLYS